MQRVNLPIVLAFVLTALVTFLVYSHVNPVQSAAATHLVISEIMTAGITADDEFVELYNPTDNPVSLTGWRLRFRTSGGTFSNPVASLSGTINSHGFFLIGNPDYAGTPSADLTYTATSSAMTSNNTVLLYSDAGTTLVDKVGMGTATDFEATTAAQPDTSKSIERKANSSSTPTSMAIGGSDQLAGNAEDTDNNGNDFVLRDTPQPQNSSSTLEPVAGPTPSASPSASASPSTSPSASPSSSPSSSPSVNPSPSVSPNPSQSPAVSPSPSVSPSPTTSPVASASVSPSPSSSPVGFPFSFRVSCNVSYRTIDFGFFIIQFPQVTCRIVNL